MSYKTKEYYKDKIEKAKLEFDLLNEAINMRIKSMDLGTYNIFEFTELLTPYLEILQESKILIEYNEGELSKLEGENE